MTMTKEQWTPEREAAMVAKAESGLEPHQIGAAVPNPLRKAGRPSLSPAGGTSKALNARIPSDLHVKVVAYAMKTGRSVSDLTRDALSAFMSADDSAESASPPQPDLKAPGKPKPSGAAASRRGKT